MVKYRVRCHTHGYIKPYFHGYTWNVKDAGVFSYNEIKDVKKDGMVKLEVVDD